MQNIKKQFSIFENYKKNNNSELIYLDSAASSLTPDSVVAKMNEYYFNYRSNIDRAISKVSLMATNEYDKARNELSNLLKCREDEIIWTSGATMSSNMLIDLISIHDDEYFFLNEGDEILTSILEHHSSLLPLQKLSKAKKMNLKFLELDENLNLNYSAIKDLVNEKTKIVSISFASNVTGSINQIKKIFRQIKDINPKVFIISDFTSAFGHVDINLKEFENILDAAYFSMHKAFGPTGVGALWIKRDISRHLSPSIVGGGIVSKVTKESASFRSDIKLFEAGTSNIAGVIGAGEAVRFLNSLAGLDFNKNILSHNQDLVKIFLDKINKINQENKDIFIKTFSANFDINVGIVSFQVFVKDKEVHPHDVADIMSRYDISIRAGHHCAEPLMNYFGVSSGLSRISFHVYNSEEDIDKIFEAIKKIKEIFGK